MLPPRQSFVTICGMEVNPHTLARNLEAVRSRIEAAASRGGRPAEDVTLVAISKTFPAAAIRAAWDAGVRHFGENRVQEWEGKQPDVADLAATWHLVGHLQSNKARRAASLFHCIDSVDSLDIAGRLDAALAESPRIAPVSPRTGSVSFPSGVFRLSILLEVRLAPEETKSGIDPSQLEVLARAVRLMPRLELAGLMCIPPPVEDPEHMRPYFRRLREMRDALRTATGAALPVLSMGMSHDFEVAIEEGATEVRVGSAIFGARA